MTVNVSDVPTRASSLTETQIDADTVLHVAKILATTRRQTWRKIVISTYVRGVRSFVFESVLLEKDAQWCFLHIEDCAIVIGHT